MSKHRHFNPEFKAKAVLESLRGEKTKTQICEECRIAPSLLAYWTERFIERAPQLFVTRRVGGDKKTHIAELVRIAEQLNLELTALKSYESIRPSSKKGNL